MSSIFLSKCAASLFSRLCCILSSWPELLSLVYVLVIFEVIGHFYKSTFEFFIWLLTHFSVFGFSSCFPLLPCLFMFLVFLCCALLLLSGYLLQFYLRILVNSPHLRPQVPVPLRRENKALLDAPSVFSQPTVQPHGAAFSPGHYLSVSFLLQFLGIQSSSLQCVMSCPALWTFLWLLTLGFFLTLLSHHVTQSGFWSLFLSWRFF